MMRLPRVLVASVLLGATLACSGVSTQDFTPTPLAATQKDWEGTWTGKDLTLTITPDGMAHYERGGTSTVSMNAPITHLGPDRIVFGIAFLVTTLRVDHAPHEVDGVWKMTLDGVELTRQ